MKSNTSYLKIVFPVIAGLLITVMILVTYNVAAAPQSCVAGPHNGHITADETWCLSDSPHELSGDVTVDAGVTLTIEAGVTVKGDSGFGGAELRVEGTLDAIGTDSQPIIFTSIADTGAYQWSGLAFDGGTGNLEYVTIRYAGQQNSVLEGILGSYQGSDLAARNSTLNMEHVTFRDVVGNNHEHGLVIENSQVEMTDCLFTNLGGEAYSDTERPMVVVGENTQLTMHDCHFTGNPNNRVLLKPGAMMGHDATLYMQPELEGYEIQENFTVPASTTLSIEPGVQVMGFDDKALKVQGEMISIGTPTQPITFTASATTGEVSRWSGLIFDGSEGRGTGDLRYVTVQYAGDTVWNLPGVNQNQGGNIYIRDVLNGEVHLENTQILSAAHQSGNLRGSDYGIFIENSHATISGTLFSHIGDGVSPETDNDYPIQISGSASTVTMDNNTFQDNFLNRVLLWPSAMMGQDATLFAEPTLESYELEGDSTVSSGSTLSIEPGVTLMGRWETELRVEGHLEAIGTSTEPITFTSSINDNSSQWSGLVFAGGTGDLRYATVRYGGLRNTVLDQSSTGYHDGSNITVYNVSDGEVHLEHVTVEDEYHFDGWHFFLDHGIYIENSRVSIANTIIQQNGDNGLVDNSRDSGIFVTGDSHVIIEDSMIQSNSGVGLLVENDDAFVTVKGSYIVNNASDGVLNRGSAIVILSGEEQKSNAIEDNIGYGVNQEGINGLTIATYNWWGDASGPTHSGNPDGTGEEVTDRVIYEPWLETAPTPPEVTQSLIQLSAPQRVAPGDTVNYAVRVQNMDTETLKNAIVVLEIPWRAEYRYSVPDGEFWPTHNQVIWKLGDVQPGDTFNATVQVWYKWGTLPFTKMSVMAMIAAENLSNEFVSYEEHLAYEELDIVEKQELTQSQVNDILTSDTELNTLFNDVLAKGYTYYGNATQLTLDDNTEWVELLLLNLDLPGDIAAVRRIGDNRHVRIENDTGVSFYDTTGGSRFDYLSAEWDFWGDMMPSQTTQNKVVAGLPTDCDAFSPFVTIHEPNSCPDPSWDDCLRNCLLNEHPKEMATPRLFGGTQSCKECQSCLADCMEPCSQCARDMWKKNHDERYRRCTKSCADSRNWDKYQCEEDKVYCYDASRSDTQYSRPQYRLTYRCNPYSCKYLPNPNLEYCPEGCAYGDGKDGVVHSECIDCDDAETYKTWERCQLAFWVHDPNALYGPEIAAPGQTLEYTVEWENVGEGTAYGVYVESTLPAEVDDSTLQIGGDGTYFPSSRTIRWEVGELAASEGDSVTYTVQIPTSVVSGTVLTAEAVVYFPSVPETTPTNPVVTLVQDVAAHNQRVETVEGVPLPISISGYSPSGNPLTYTITEQPMNGELSGTAPDLTYTPAVNFEGVDSFEFTASDGTQTSLPARVTIIVQTGDETIPPTILLTYPRDGDRDVKTDITPLQDGVYPPMILAYIDEPLDADTITTTSVLLQSEKGEIPDYTVSYDEYLRAIRIDLHEPLRLNETYIVAISTEVKDTSGNSLAQDFTWHFTTWSQKLYLPLIVR
jgi:uncharacterized repeat protein (TIGR01451 family)